MHISAPDGMDIQEVAAQHVLDIFIRVENRVDDEVEPGQPPRFANLVEKRVVFGVSDEGTVLEHQGDMVVPNRLVSCNAR